MNVTEAVSRLEYGMAGSSSVSGNGTEGALLTGLFSQLIQERKEEFIVKLRTGTTEPSYQIGAGSYTEREWDKLLKGFDAAEDAIRKAAGLDEDEPEKTSQKEKAEAGKAEESGAAV